MFKRLGPIALVAMALFVAAGAYFVCLSPYKLYVVHTGSMGQTIPTKSAVVVRKGTYHVGRVITFTSNGNTVTHRLLQVRPDSTIVTKGDANASADPSNAPRANIVGEVVLAPRELGWWLVYFGHPINLVAVLLLCFGVRFLWLLDKPTESA